MTTTQTTEYPPLASSNIPQWIYKCAKAIHRIMRGKTDNTGTVTLTANSATTTLSETEDRIGANTVIIFTPTTANAAAAIGGLYVSARSITNKTFTLTHANNAQLDRTFSYILVG